LGKRARYLRLPIGRANTDAMKVDMVEQTTGIVMGNWILKAIARPRPVMARKQTGHYHHDQVGEAILRTRLRLTRAPPSPTSRLTNAKRSMPRAIPNYRLQLLPYLLASLRGMNLHWVVRLRGEVCFHSY
jgi:hypothetical protein